MEGDRKDTNLSATTITKIQFEKKNEVKYLTGSSFWMILCHLHSVLALIQERGRGALKNEHFLREFSSFKRNQICHLF